MPDTITGKRINEYTAVTDLANGDSFILERGDGSGTRRTLLSSLATAVKNAMTFVNTKSAMLAATQNNVPVGAKAVKELVSENLTAGDLMFTFSTDGEGNYGYLGADGSFVPFSGGELAYSQYVNLGITDANATKTFSTKFTSIGRSYNFYASSRDVNKRSQTITLTNDSDGSVISLSHPNSGSTAWSNNGSAGVIPAGTYTVKTKVLSGASRDAITTLILF